MNEVTKDNDLVRIVVIDVSMPLSANVYDEVVLPVIQATVFVQQYIDMSKYRIITV